MARGFPAGMAFWGTRMGMRLAVMLARWLPRRAIFALSDLLARVGYIAFSGFRARSMKNLAIALGDSLSAPEIRAIVQQSLRNFFLSFAEIPVGLAMPPDKVREEIAVEGREYLDAALARGRGVILLSGHLGNFIILGSRLALSGYRTHVLVNQPARGRFAAVMEEYRSLILQTAIPARPRQQAFRRVVEALRRNEVVVVIADEYRRGGGGVRVPFFGRPVLARRGPVTLALRTGAAVVPGYLVRAGNRRLTLKLEPELLLERARRDAAEVAANTRRITSWLEQTVRKYPDQWNWMTVHFQDETQDLGLAKNRRLHQLSH